ncbi:MAG: BatD family protein [Phycisphaerales bacterium]
MTRLARVFAAPLLACAVFHAASNRASAQQVPAAVKPPEVTVALSDDTVELGDSLVYQITIDGVSSADPPTLPGAGGAKVDFLGGHDESSRSIMTINGRTTENSVLRYIMQWRITPDRKGPGAVEGFTLDVGGHKTNVPRVQFNVNEPKPNPNFKLTLESDATTAYVGEPIRMRLVWLLGNNVQSASFSGSDGGSNFDIAAIDPRGPQSRGKQLLQNEPYRPVPFLNGEAIITQSQSEFGGRAVPRFTMDLVVTPRKAGKIEVGPFRIALDEVVGRRSMMDSLFSGNNTKRSVVTSNALTLDVKPLPTEGKPADFGGLVGVFTVDTKAGNTEANVGDPVPLTLTISGPEPLEALKPPNLDLQQNFAAEFKAAPEGWETPTTVVAAPGERTFTTTIRPKSAQVTEVPAIRLPYFDTRTGKYAVATSKVIPLKVRAAREFTAADALRSGGSGFSLPTATASSLTSAPAGVGANSESFDALRDQRVGILAAATAPTGLALLLVPPIALVIASMAAWKSRVTDPARAKRRQAVREGKRALASASTPSQILAAARIGLAPFVGAKAEAIASSDPEAAQLPEATALRARELLQRLEAATFDGVSVDVANAKSQAHELLAMLNP